MLNRRAFVAAGASALATLGTFRIAYSQGRAITRRPVQAMSTDDPDLAAYRRAVAAMKALPASDPRNWNRFADIHRNFCPHANWYFLPWHRAYLVALERICRDLSGKADFALPYWDWTSQRQLPAAFAAGDPRSNPLNHPRPGFSRSQLLTDDMVGTAVISRVLNSPDFEAFGSTRPRGQNGAGPQWQRRMGSKTEFEFNPHDGIHNTLGGDMGSIERASRDPIFYLHHANVDRIWAVWNRRGNDNSAEANWRNFAFSRNFPNPDGSDWDVSVGGLQSTQALGYQYEGDAIGQQIGSAEDAFAADPVVVYPRRYRQYGQPDRYQRGGGHPDRAYPSQSYPRDAYPSHSRPIQSHPDHIHAEPAGPRHDIPPRAAPEQQALVETARGDTAEHLHAYRQIMHDDRLPPNGGLRRLALASGGSIYMAAADNARPASRERPIGIAVPFGRPLGQVIDPSTLLPSTPGSQRIQRRVWATIRDIEPPADPTTRLRVFVNCGDLSPSTPVSNPHYATSVSFFGGGHAAHPGGHGAAPHGATVSVDLTQVLSRISRTREFQSDRLVVQLLPVCHRGTAAASSVRPRRVDIAII